MRWKYMVGDYLVSYFNIKGAINILMHDMEIYFSKNLDGYFEDSIRSCSGWNFH